MYLGNFINRQFTSLLKCKDKRELPFAWYLRERTESLTIAFGANLTELDLEIWSMCFYLLIFWLCCFFSSRNPKADTLREDGDNDSLDSDSDLDAIPQQRKYDPSTIGKMHLSKTSRVSQKVWMELLFSALQLTAQPRINKKSLTQTVGSGERSHQLRGRVTANAQTWNVPTG